MKSSRLFQVIFLSGFITAGCGGSTSSNPTVEPTSGALLPWKVGNRWTYRVTDDGEVSEKETTVGELEPVGGTGPNRDVLANKVVTRKGTADKTVSWQAVSGSRLVRYREQSFRANTDTVETEDSWAPAKLHVDEAPEHAAVGASWLESYEETELETGEQPSTETVREQWTVIADDETVTVPAGTLRALVLRKSGTSKTKTYWFVRGIGKVKETGGQTEELVSYELVP
ncbi:hypothetical protein [Vitiosangium sp. GDMCC 1.1324]|uniref:hypothetical protein n=1 Tax=Vitiosangium sp. (strain GDMCC 1.1324) TaxID=2138576 RepID=UPI000D361C4D|nr:hypothetical protein [Vitiosangium sp. GDMCC 1.1324]PTL81648.1 hypothetical protein DAT35_22135 [Vitiosangium sp. GDMCC 1.1324]